MGDAAGSPVRSGGAPSAPCSGASAATPAPPPRRLPTASPPRPRRARCTASSRGTPLRRSTPSRLHTGDGTQRCEGEGEKREGERERRFDLRTVHHHRAATVHRPKPGEISQRRSGRRVALEGRASDQGRERRRGSGRPAPALSRLARPDHARPRR